MTPDTSPAEVGVVTEKTPAMLLLPHLLEMPGATVDVMGSNGGKIGEVNAISMLRAFSEMLNDGGEASWVEASVAANDYSASGVARAVEDADAHLLDLITSVDPSEAGRMRLSLKVSHCDPSGVVRSLERYGYEVLSSDGIDTADIEKARTRLSELQVYLNV